HTDSLTDVSYAPPALNDPPDSPEPFALALEKCGDGLGFPLRHHEHHADSHVKRPQTVALGNIAGAPNQLEDGQHRPRAHPDLRRASRRQDAGWIVGEPASGDVD